MLDEPVSSASSAGRAVDAVRPGDLAAVGLQRERRGRARRARSATSGRPAARRRSRTGGARRRRRRTRTGWSRRSASSTTDRADAFGPGAVRPLLAAQPVVGAGRLGHQPGRAQRHGALDVVPGVGVRPRRPGNRPAALLRGGDGSRRWPRPPRQAMDPGHGGEASGQALGSDIPGAFRDVEERLLQVDHEALADQPGPAPARRLRVSRRPPHDVPDQQPVVGRGTDGGRASTPNAHLSHQYGACSACAWWLPVALQPRAGKSGDAARRPGRCARGPPSTSW